MDRILYKEANGDLTCRARDFDKVFPTLYAYEELEMTPEDIKQTLLNFGSFLCEITGGRMSKTNYTVQAMVDEAYANFERGCDECSDRQELAEIKKELEGLKNSYQQLQEINNRTFQSNMAMGSDLKRLKADMLEFAKDVAHQFGYHSHQNGRLTLTHGGLATLEWAFDILGWENPHPDPENECQHEGCHHYASCGTPTKDGYKRLCIYHFNELRAKDTNVPGKKED